METRQSRKGRRVREAKLDKAREAIVSEQELARLGEGEIAYIKELTSDEAMEAYPSLEDLPRGLNLFALFAADGKPIALTDDRATAIEHAMGDKLEIASLH